MVNGDGVVKDKSVSSLAQDIVDKAAENLDVSEEEQKDIKEKAEEETVDVDIESKGPVEEFGERAERRIKGDGDEKSEAEKSREDEKSRAERRLEERADEGDPVAEEVERQLDLIGRVEENGVTEREREIVGGTELDIGRQAKRLIEGEVKESRSLEDLAESSVTGEDSFATEGSGGQRFVEAGEEQEEIQTDVEEGREKKSETVENLESNIESTENLLSDVESGDLQGIETEERGELQGREAIEFLENRLERLEGERTRVEEEFERFEEEAGESVQELERFRDTRDEFEEESLENRPFKGVTTESVLGDLSPVERTALAVETGVTNPEDVFVGLFTEGQEGVREEVEERLGYIRGRTAEGAGALDLAGESAGKVGAVMGAGAAGGIAGEAVAGGAGVLGGYLGSKVGAAGSGAAIGRGLGVAADVGVGLWQGRRFAQETRDLLESGDAEDVELGQERLFQAGMVVPSAVAGAYQYRGLSQPSNLVSGLDEAVSGTALEGTFVGRGVQDLSNVFDESVTGVRSFQSGRSFIDEDSVVLDPLETGRARSVSTDVTEGGVVGGFEEVTRRPETTIVRGSEGGSVVRGADPLRFVEVETSAGREMRFATSTDLTGGLDESGGFEGLAETRVLKVGEDARVYDPTDLEVSRQLVDVEAEGGFNVVQEESVLVTGDEGSFVGRLIAGRGDVVGRAGDVDFDFGEESFVTRTELDEGVVETRRGVGLMETGRGAGEVESRTVFVDEDVLSQGFEGGFSVERGVEDFGVERGVTDFAEGVDETGSLSGGGLTGARRLGDGGGSGVGPGTGLFTEDLYRSVSEQAVRQYVGRNIGVDVGESVSPTGVAGGGDAQGFEGSGLTQQTFETGEAPRTDAQGFGVRGTVSRLIDEDVSGVGVGTGTGQEVDTVLDENLVDSPSTVPGTVTGLRTGIRDNTGVLSRSFTGLGRGVSPVSRLETSAFTGLGERELVSPVFTGVQGFEQVQETGAASGLPGFPSTVPVEPGTGGGSGFTTPSLRGSGEVELGLEERDVSGDVTGTRDRGLRLGILSASAAEFLPGVEQASVPESADTSGFVFGVEPEEFEETEGMGVLSLETDVF